MRRLMMVAALILILNGLCGRTALAGSVPGKIATAPSIPAGGTTTGGTGGLTPRTGVDPTGKFARVCPKYPQKYAVCASNRKRLLLDHGVTAATDPDDQPGA